MASCSTYRLNCQYNLDLCKNVATNKEAKTMEKKALQSQIERILDENPGQVHNVIVQMEERTNELQKILETSSEALGRRQMLLSARELIPANAQAISEEGQLSNSDRRKLREAAGSFASLVALAGMAALAPVTLRQEGLDVLKPLMESDVVKSAMASSVNRLRRKKSSLDQPPQGFRQSWSSRSALLRMSRSDLSKLPESSLDISGVFLNGQVTLPPVAEVRNIPAEIAHNPSSSWGIERIGALSAWGAYGTRGDVEPEQEPVKVAVLDTGVDSSHPELQGKIKDWAEFDQNGAPVHSSPHDSDTHGTHVCGIIAGCNPHAPSAKYPFIGVAPEIELMAGIVLKRGKGTDYQIIAGIDWAIENGADVINMSLGGISLQPDVTDVYTRSILNANRSGIPVVISVGNSGAQTSGTPGNDCFAFAVGATDYFDRPGGFSAGRTQVIRVSRFIDNSDLPLVYSKPEVSAPGVAVYSCVPGNKYDTWNGTSMAAPHVSGAMALMLAATDIRSVPANRRAFLIQDLIASSVDELGEAGQDHRYGLGRINVLRAIASAKELGY